MADRLLYREVSARKRWWMWLLGLLPAALAWTFFALDVVLGVRIDDDAPAALPWVLVAVLGVLLPLFVVSLRLIVEVRPGDLRWRYVPIWGGRIAIADVREAHAREFRPVSEYMGWGLRWAPGKGWCATVSGTRGVQLELASGRRFLLESREPRLLLAAIERARRSDG